MPFTEHDVSVDRTAAQEMVRLTQQMGVPVIADEQEAIVGFDQPRLARMAARHQRAPGLGLRVADRKDAQGAGIGAYVASVRTDSPAQRAGAQVGDLVVELSGIPVRSADDLEQIAGRRQPRARTSMQVSRNGETITLIIPG